MSNERLRIGFIPLCDATALIVAVDKGFAAAEGLEIELVREVSWSNIRDKLNIGLFDAAHLIAPVAIASSLGIGHVKVPIVAPFGLGVNGNAITVSPALYGAFADAAADTATPRSDGVGACARPRRRRPQGQRRRAAHLRHDLSVLDPQLSSALLDGRGRRRSGRGRAARGAAAALYGREPRQPSRRRFLRRRALELGGGRSRHRLHPAFRLARFSRVPPRRCSLCAQPLGEEHPDLLAASCAPMPARLPSSRTSPIATRSALSWPRPTASASTPEVIRRTLDGRMKVAPDGAVRVDDRYILIGREGAARPEPAAGRVALRADGAVGAGPAVGRTACDREGCLSSRPLRCRGRNVHPRHGRRTGRRHRCICRTAFDPDDIAAHLAPGNPAELSRSRHCLICCIAQKLRTVRSCRRHRPPLASCLDRGISASIY